MTESSFGGLYVFTLGSQVCIATKVWNEVVSLDLFWVSWDPLVVSLFFSLGRACDGSGDINVSTTKVWNEIVLWVRFGGFMPVPMMTKFFFSSSQISVSVTNLGILWAEIWNKVVLLKALMGSWFPSQKWLSIKLRIDLNERWEFNF